MQIPVIVNKYQPHALCNAFQFYAVLTDQYQYFGAQYFKNKDLQQKLKTSSYRGHAFRPHSLRQPGVLS